MATAKQFEDTKKSIMLAGRKLSRYQFMHVVHGMTSGVDYRGCSKGDMAEDLTKTCFGCSVHDCTVLFANKEFDAGRLEHIKKKFAKAIAELED